MLLIQLIGQLPYGTPEFYGQVAVIFCLILTGKSSQEILLSREGVTQVDPSSMMFYAIIWCGL